MHGVVGHDKKSGLEQGAHQNRQSDQAKGQIGKCGGEQDHQAPQPTQNDPSSQEQATPGGCRQRANLSSSAAEASRSIATK